MDKNWKKKIYYALLTTALLESLSFYGYMNPGAGALLFWLVLAAFAGLAVFNLRLALTVELFELIIGSKGYLFAAPLFGFNLSIRIAFWAVVLAVFVIKYIWQWRRKEHQVLAAWHSRFLLPLLALALTIVWGLANAWLRHAAFSNWFFDFNNWLYLLLIIPLAQEFKTREDLKELASYLSAAVAWLGLETLLLLYQFSHNLDNANYGVYFWIRNSGVGEITQMASGFYRIFLQSQLFCLLGYLASTLALTQVLWRKVSLNRAKIVWAVVINVVSLAAIIISFSRSFWVGLGLGLAALLFILCQRHGWSVRRVLGWLGLVVAGAVLALALIFVTVKLPWPTPLLDFSTSLLTDRATSLDDAAGASRWNLLKPLANQIINHPVLGSGFGQTVTYISDDPRIRAVSPDGSYTTYAFEWGWLDLWLKLGLIGIAAYLWLAWRLLRSGLARSAGLWSSGLALAWLATLGVNIFSPYVNHPLGLGLLLLTALAIELEGQPAGLD